MHHRIRSVTIIPKDGSLGLTRHAPLKFARGGVFDDSPRGVDRAEKYIVICFAGPFASRKLAPRSTWALGGYADMEDAKTMFSHLSSTDEEYNRHYFSLLLREAQLLVDFRWPEINAVADDLIQHRTLDADGVRTAIHRSLGCR